MTLLSRSVMPDGKCKPLSALLMRKLNLPSVLRHTGHALHQQQCVEHILFRLHTESLQLALYS